MNPSRAVSIDSGRAIGAPTVETYAAEALAPRTRARYASTWRQWCAWADAHRVPRLPIAPPILCEYLRDQAAHGMRPSSITTGLSALRFAHESAGLPPPTDDARVRTVLRGIRRTHGTAVDRKAALRIELMRRVIAAIPPDRVGRRDKALITLGWSCALRRDELCALTVADIEDRSPDGIVVHIRRSKTDQEGAGQEVGVRWAEHVDVCPITLLMDWLDAAHITDGPLFRRAFRGGRIGRSALTGQSVTLILRSRLRAAGVVDVEAFAGHSLRSGLITEAAMAGVSLPTIMKTSRHRNLNVLGGYIRDATLLEETAASLAGL